MSIQTVYSVHAYRWGDRECHSYHVGVYSTKLKALKAAEAMEDYRGGKYECEVIGQALDASDEEAARYTVQSIYCDSHPEAAFARMRSECQDTQID